MPSTFHGQSTRFNAPIMSIILILRSYVYSLITGLQGPDAPDYYKVVASCKHYA